MDTILDQEKWKFIVRKTKIICTAGPACWSEEGLGKLLEAGCNVLRLNFSHGDHKGHFEVLERFRKVRTRSAVQCARGWLVPLLHCVERGDRSFAWLRLAVAAVRGRGILATWTP